MAARSLLPLLVAALLALPPAGVAAQPPPAAWRAEPLPADGVTALQAVVFDRLGRGLVAWEGFDPAGRPRRFTALAARDPAGGWRVAPRPGRITWGGVTLHPYGATRVLLVARRTTGLARFDRARLRLVYAYGRSTGAFGRLRRLDDDVDAHAAAANARGAGLVAWASRRDARVRTAERDAGRGFGAPRVRSPRGAFDPAVAVGARGDRVLAWVRGGRVEARIRRAGGFWGSVRRVGRAAPGANRLHALVTPAGRIVVAWSGVEVGEGRRTRVAVHVAERDRDAGWRARRLERAETPGLVGEARALPVADERGAVAVAWTGSVPGGTGVKLAPLAAGEVGPVKVVSGEQADAVLEDAATGPGGALALCWSAGGGADAHAAVGRGGALGPPQRLPLASTAGGGCRAAFQPVTGEPVVIRPVLEPPSVTLRAAVGSPLR